MGFNSGFKGLMTYKERSLSFLKYVQNTQVNLKDPIFSPLCKCLSRCKHELNLQMERNKVAFLHITCLPKTYLFETKSKARMEGKCTERPLLFHVNTRKREQPQAATEAGIAGPSRPRLGASLFCGCILG